MAYSASDELYIAKLQAATRGRQERERLKRAADPETQAKLERAQSHSTNQRNLVSKATQYGLSRDELVQCTHLPAALEYAEGRKLKTILGRLMVLLCEERPDDVEQFLIDTLENADSAKECVSPAEIEALAEVLLARWNDSKSETDVLVPGPFVKEGLLCLGCNETEAMLHARDCDPSEVASILKAGAQQWTA